MLKSKLIVILLTLVNLAANAQKVIPGTSYTQFSLNSKSDTIDFVVAETDLTVKKPIFFFAQGSMPIPLFVDFPGQGVYSMTLSNFDLNTLNKHFHVVVISTPKIPVVVNVNQVNSNYCYMPDSTNRNSVPDAYVKADNLENYIARANKVLGYLSKQKWVDNSRLVAAGHSQGSRIVAELTARNPKITHAGLFGFNPLGRVHERVWLNYKDAMKGTISWEKLDSLQQQQYDFQQSIYADKGEDIGLIAWKSFTGIGFERLSQIKTPLYIAYGTEDKCAFLNELIPLYFIQAGKTNYEVKRYPNLEHNYFPVVEGKPDYENGKWMEVINAFVEWSLKN
ncbi:Alpha/beta hydrolase family protein [compost metagenome]